MADVEFQIRTLERSMEDLTVVEPSTLNNLASLLVRQFKQTGNSNVLHRAVGYSEKAVSESCEGDPKLPMRLKNLALNLDIRFNNTRSLSDLQRSIELLRTAGHLTEMEDTTLLRKIRRASVKLEAEAEQLEEGHSDQWSSFSLLGEIYREQSIVNGLRSDIDRAVLMAEKALYCIFKSRQLDLLELRGRANEAQVLGSLNEHRSFRQMEADYQGLSAACQILGLDLSDKLTIEDCEYAVNESYCILEEDLLRKLTFTWRIGYKSTGDAVYLDRPIRCMREMVRMAADEGSQSPRWHFYLGTELYFRYLQLSRLADLDECIRSYQVVVDYFGAINAYPGFLLSLGSAFHARFMEFDKMEDLNASISFTRDGLEIGSKNDHALQHPSTADCMTNMFLDLGIRYDRTLRIQDLMESVSIGKEALREMPETLNSSTRACRLTAFAVLANKRFEYTKTNDDLDSALHAVRAALKLTSSDDQQLPFRLDLLGECLFKRSQWTGRTDELDEAVEQLDRAVELTPDADMDIYHRLRNLSYAFTERYLQSRRLVDLEDAYRIGRKALRLIPEGSVDRSLFCSQMSQVLHLKAERLDSLETLQQSIDLQRQALNSGCINNRQRAGLYSTLGGLLVNRFVKSNNTKDLERGIELHRKANAAISDDDVTLRCLTLHGLGGALALKYDNTQNLMDLEEAILSTEMALKFTSPDKPNYASELAHLALMYSSSGTEERQQHALRLYLNSFSAKNASPTDRLGSAWGALRLWRQLKVHPDAKHMCCEAVQLMAFQCNRTLNQADQQRHISSFPTLTARACSLLLSVGGCLVEAINILEVGRSIILGYIINDHTDISDLQASYPQHARKYIKLVEDVNRQYPDTEGAGTQAARTNRRIQAVYELNQSVEEIRQLPGYDRFLRGPTVNQLKHYAREGTVVIVLVSEISSHAIVISTAGVESIELSSLTAREVSDWLGQDLTRFSHRQEDGKRNKRYLQFLLWIWKSCVRLVLDYLGLLEDTPPSHPRNLPRIWWIGAGFASSLPFHAAGDHSAGSFDNTLSRAISSYAPTVKALSYAREQCGRRRSQDSPRLLYVAMPTTPAAKPLPGVNKEEQAIREAIGDTFSFQSLTLPDSETVMQKMKRCEVIHFACHGVSNPVDPSKSCLLLQTNGKELNDGPIVDKLTVQQISEMHLPGGNIAYLSACSTAENKAHFLADEALHIASAFQAAGFSHVIGTLWPVYDTVSADVASNFYSEIRYATSMGDKRVAASLHRSLLLVREKLRNRPLAWAGYIHVGA